MSEFADILIPHVSPSSVPSMPGIKDAVEQEKRYIRWLLEHDHFTGGAIDIPLALGTLERVHMLLGEPFILDIDDDDKISLRHKQWSLSGEGITLLEAEQNLIAEAEELAEVFLTLPQISLSFEARRMRDFLLRVVRPRIAQSHAT